MGDELEPSYHRLYRADLAWLREHGIDKSKFIREAVHKAVVQIRRGNGVSHD